MRINSDVIFGFAGSILASKYDNPTPIPAVHKEWWEICTSNNRYVAIAAPRGHGKSTAITKAYVLAEALFKQRRFIVLVSDTETQATLFLNDIKEELTNNEHLIELFEIDGFDKDTESDIIVRMKDGHSFRILARGAEQRVRGLKWLNLRPDLIVCDDLENEELVYNKDRREKFRKWFYGALIPCLSADGIVRIVGTILHLDSLLNRMMPRPFDKETVNEPLKMWSKRKQTWKSFLYRAHNADFSYILWRDRYTKEFFLEKKADYDSQGIGEVYAQEFLNYPIDDSVAFFKKDDLREIRPADKDKEKVYYVGVDFAISTEERSDYTVMVVAGMDAEGILYIEDVRRGRWDALEIIEELFRIQKYYKPELFIFERGAIEKALGAVLNVEMMKRGIFLSISKMTPTKDKQQRARAIQARIRAGGVRFNKEASFYPDMEEELVRFPKSRHDDQVDALSWVGLALDQFVEARTKEEIEEDEYNETFQEDFFSTSRDKVTGY